MKREKTIDGTPPETSTVTLLGAIALSAVAFYGVSTTVISQRDSQLSIHTQFASANSEEKKPAKAGKKKSKKKKKEPAVEVLEEKPTDFVGAEGGDSASFDADLEKPKAIDAVLLIDASGSMLRTDPRRLRDQAAKLFIRSLGEEDRVALFEFDKETRMLSGFTGVTEENVETLDGLIEHVATTGTRTNLESPVISASDYLDQSGRPEAVKAVVLLSDGQMDPDKDPAVAESLLKKLFDEDLPAYSSHSIRLYTLAMSEEADKQLLQDMARKTNALSWYAPDVSTIHSKFSDLFLALKQPQVVSAEAGGFTIDSSVREATFYITRKAVDQEISLLSPKGQSVTQFLFPPGTRWYHAELFDVVTIPKPTPGQWSVQGIEAPDGFATLLTDLKLQVKWPSPNLNVGDDALFFGRLASKDKTFADEGLSSLLVYQYRVVNTKTGTAAASGTMHDDGKDGDEKAGDGIFAGSVKIEEEGEYKLLVGVTTPTFTRQQVVPFTASKGLVDLEIKKGDEFAGTKDAFLIRLGIETKKLKNVEVRLIAQYQGPAAQASEHGSGEHGAASENVAEDHAAPAAETGSDTTADEEHEKVLSFKAEKDSGDSLLYTVEAEKLPAGRYKVSAKINGKDTKKKEVSGESKAIEYSSSSEATLPEDEHAEESTPSDGSLIPGLISVVLALLWGGAASFFFLKKIDLGKGLPPREKKYSRPESLVSRIAELNAKHTEDRRKPNPQDFIVFELVSDALGKPEAKPSEEVPGASE